MSEDAREIKTKLYVTDYSTLIVIDYLLTLIFIIVLLWFLVRSNWLHPARCADKEGLNIVPDLNRVPIQKPFNAVNIQRPLTDTKYEFGQKLNKGLYGDVVTYLYDDTDSPYRSQWGGMYQGVYVPNSKKYWINTNTPREAAFW